MYDERPKGIYVVKYKKIIDNVEYIKTETTMVNGNNECVNYVKEYNKPIPFGKEVDGWTIL